MPDAFMATHRSRADVASVLATAAILSIAAIVPGPADAAELTGRVLNGSEPDSGVADLEVRLMGRLATGERLDRVTTTRADGGFGFAELPGDTADVYVLSTNFKGVDYVSRFLDFTLGVPGIETNFVVYDVTDDPGILRLEGHHYIVDAQSDPRSVLVTEVVAIANDTARTFQSHQPLIFPLPPSATSFEALDGFDGAYVEHGGVHLAADIQPGRFDAAFRYLLPASAPLEVSFPGGGLPADEISLLIAPTDIDVSGDGLSFTRSVPLQENMLFDRYAVTTSSPAGAFRFRAAVERPSAAAPWIISVCMLAAFGLLVFAREHREARAPLSADVRALVRDRDRHLAAVVDLERAHAAGSIDDAAFERDRERLMIKAGAVQELLEARAESS